MDFITAFLFLLHKSHYDTQSVWPLRLVQDSPENIEYETAL